MKTKIRKVKRPLRKKPAPVQFGCSRECGTIHATVLLPGENDIIIPCHKCGATHRITGSHDGYGHIKGYKHEMEKMQ
jgi:transcription elongation factor Elf1